MSLHNIRDHYPILKKHVHGKSLIYLDNAATQQVSKEVLDSITHYYTDYHSNVHRGIYALSEMSTNMYEMARKTVSEFLNVASDDIIFTSGTTHSINLIARVLQEYGLTSQDEILITEMEHHSNIIIWQEITKACGCQIKYIPVLPNGQLNINLLDTLLSDKTKIVSFCHSSNVSGIRNPIESISQLIREKTSAITIIDGAQGIAHENVDLKKVGCDVYCFSGHKIGSPTGIGVLYVRKGLLEKLTPTCFGGGTVIKTTKSHKVFAERIVERFEPGTPNISGAIGLAAAIRHRNTFASWAFEHEASLMNYLQKSLSSIPQICLIGSSSHLMGALSFSFNNKCSAYDMAKFLDQYGVAVRSGYHCAQPYLHALGHTQVVRISPAFYNTEEELSQTVDYIKMIIKLFD